MPKLTDLTKEMTTAPAPDDWLHIVDRSDTSESPQGSSYKIQKGLLTAEDGYDATVGLAGSGADYNLVQDAIDASKVNLLVIGEYTNSETVATGANRINITIAKKWTMNEGYITIGAGGLDIWGNGSELHGVYTLVANKMFLGSGALRIDGVRVDTSASTVANTGISGLTSGTEHIINNCSFALSNTAECGFKNAGSSSSFTNLNVIGGGAACEGFIPDAKGAVISALSISGTVKDVSTFISSSTTPCVINSIRFTGTNRPIISLGVDANQVDNINGDIEIDPTDTSINQISNCYVADIDLTDSSASQNKFSNCYVTSVNTTIAGVFNQFINFESDANLIVDGGANFFTHSRCPDVTVNGDANQFISASFTAYTDNGTANAYISEISADGTLVSNSDRLLATQKAIKTYVDGHPGTNDWLRVTGTPNYLLPYTAADDIGATLARITKGWFTDIESYNMPTVGGTSINANAVLDLTSGEVTQLAAIGTTTISAGQWVYLGAMNQGVATTDTVAFADLTIDNININGDAIVSTANLDLGSSSGTGFTRIVDENGDPVLSYDNANDKFTFSDPIVFSAGTDVNEIATVIDESSTDDELATALAIKTYADTVAKGITVNYFFSDTAEGTIANYDLMYPADTGQAQSTAAASIVAADTLIQTFITQTTEPNFTILLAGIYDIHIHAAKTTGNKDTYIYAKFYKRTHPGGVETLLATSDNSATLTGSNVGYTLHFSLLSDEVLATTDRLVVKFYGTPTGSGTDPTATLYLEGTNTSRIDIHTTASAWLLDQQNIIYRNGAGNDANSGKNMGVPKLTLASALAAASAQSPTATNLVTVKDLGGARISEDVTVPSCVILDMSDALVVGQVTLGVTMSADSYFYFNKAAPDASSQCIRISGAGTRYIRGNSTAGALNSTFISASGGAVVYADIVNANAVATGANFYTLTTGAVLFLKAQTFRETIVSTAVGSTVFRNIADDGANADTSSINATGDQIIRGKDKVTLGTSVADVLEVNGSYQKWIVNPHFIAYKNAQATNATGDGTVYDIAMSQVDANIGSHYNTGTGVFTAPVTGLYHFNIVLFLDNISSSHNDLNIRLNTTTSTWWLVQVDPGNVRSVTTELILNGSIDVLMNAGNTAKFQVQVSGLTKTVHVEIASHCSGRLITRT